jgi:phage FluMu gp28-like protein
VRDEALVPAADEALPTALLPYQQELIGLLDTHEVVVCEKSRRIGMTWAFGSAAVLRAGAARAAGGMDVLYVGTKREMAREFVDVCGMWARAFAIAADAAEEVLWSDGEDRDIQAFRVQFGSGFKIVALSNRPRSMRGYQGFVVLDEAAFHDDLAELLKAALAMLMWGGRVLVISTHNGADNPFAELVGDIRADKRPYGLLRVTFDDALEQGLYRRICLVRGTPWSPAAELAWRDRIVALYADGADEELFCVPRRSGGAWLSRALIEDRMTLDAPVLRWAAPDGFEQRSDAERQAVLLDWLEDAVGPCLLGLDRAEAHCAGLDFGRSGDLTVLAVPAIGVDLIRRVRLVVELRNTPFRQQEQAVFFVLDRLPRLLAGAFDARGNGQFLAEVAAQRYGFGRIEQVMLAERWYMDHMPPLKAALEDATLLLPRDALLLDDLRAVQVIDGVPRLPKGATQRGEQRRHGDGAIAIALGYAASRKDVAPIEFEAAGRRVAAGIGDAFLGGHTASDGFVGFV